MKFYKSFKIIKNKILKRKKNLLNILIKFLLIIL